MKTEKFERIAKIISSIAIPLIIAYFGWQIEQRISNKNLNKEYVELSISILTSKEGIEPSIRNWAISVLQQNSPVKLSSEALIALEKGSTLFIKESADKNFEDEKYEQSLYLYEELKKGQPENSENYSKAGYSLYKIGKLEDALKEFNRAIELNPKNSQFYFLRSLVYVKQGNLERSNNDLNKSIELNPKQDAAYNNRGLNKMKLGDTISACGDFSKSLELGNKNAIGNFNMYCKIKK